LVKAEDWAYVAGLIDGEANISLNAKKPSGGSVGHTTYDFTLSPNITIVSADRKFLERLREKIGLGEVISQGTGFYERRSYGLRFDRLGEIKEVLTNCLPHMLLKKKLAELMLEYVNSRLANKNIHRAPYTKRELEIVLEMAILNGSKAKKTVKRVKSGLGVV